MARRKKQRIVKDIHLSGIADKGMAVGRDSEGQVYFIEGAVPGDLVTAVIKRKKKGIPFGQVLEVQELSDFRTESFCSHFGVCGGCKWQNLLYEEQLRQKEQQVRDAINRIAKVDVKDFLPILANADQKEYRNKLEYSFSNKRWLTEEEINSDQIFTSNKALGFHKPGLYDKIIDIDKCHLQIDISNRIRNFVRELTREDEFSYYDIKGHRGLLRELVIRSNHRSEVMMILILGEFEREVIEPLLDRILEAFPEIVSCHYIINTKWNSSYSDLEPIHYAGNEYLEEKLGEVRYLIGAKSFFQTNSKQAFRLYSIARDFADLQSSDNVYDLYTGLGSIALFMADACKNVVGIEENEEAIRLAKKNADLNQIENCSFYCGDVKNILKDEFVEEHGKADVIITDPPRVGMHKEVVEMFLKIEAEKIVYISCNPATQARDIALMSEKYSLEKIQAVDMFPHTHHVESVALLKLKK